LSFDDEAKNVLKSRHQIFNDGKRAGEEEFGTFRFGRVDSKPSGVILNQGDQTIGKKLPNFSKSSPNSCQARKCQNIYILKVKNKYIKTTLNL